MTSLDGNQNKTVADWEGDLQTIICVERYHPCGIKFIC